MEDIYLGIDVGTSGCKAIAINRHCETVALSSARYDDSLLCKGLGSYDQDAEVLLNASMECIRGLAQKAGAGCRVVAMGFTGQMHGLVALDEKLRPLRPIISCVDFRNFKQNAEISRAFGGEEGLLPYTNNKMIPSCTGGKILWMKENEPALYEKIRIIVNPKDYVRTALTGIPATDQSDASGFGLYDVKNHCWNEELITRLEIPKSILPPVYGSGEVVGTVRPEMARRLSISPDAVVVAGAGDAIMQTVGAGAVAEGIYGVVLGSGGLISASLRSCAENKGARVQIYCSALQNQWVAYAGLMSVGTSVNWFREQFYHVGAETGAEFLQMERDAASIREGSDGLLFYPALLGQRNPVEDPFTKGVIVGLSPAHTKAHMYRALLEGLAFGMREVCALIREVSAPLKKIHISGGGAVSNLWCQIFADVLQVPVCRMKDYSVCGAMGVAVLAANARDAHADLEEIYQNRGIDVIFEPSQEKKAVYDALYAIYQKMYPASAPLFADLKRYEETLSPNQQ